jgi:hypothetical protein
MKNPVSLWSATTVSLLLTLLSFGCLSCKQGPVVPPARPAGVPQSAVWAGGCDGGSFIDCASPTLSKTNPCTVYDDYTGEVFMSGTFVLRVNSSAAPAEAPEFNAADGVNIFLTDGSRLEPGPKKSPGTSRNRRVLRKTVSTSTASETRPKRCTAACFWLQTGENSSQAST